MMKKTHILYLFMLVSLVWFLRTNLVDLRQVGLAIAQAQWPWLAAAFALRLVYFGLFALIYQAAFGAVGVSSRWRGLLPLTLAATFIDSTAPMGGTASMALFVDDARRRQQSPSRTLAGALLFYIAFVGVFLLGLGGVLLFMLGQGMVTAVQLTSAFILTTTIVGLMGLLWLGHSHETRLQQLLQGIQWLVNRAGQLVHRPNLLDTGWAARQSSEFAAAGRAITASPRRLWWVVFAAFAAHIVAIFGLMAIFFAFQLPASLPIILAGYAMTVLFTNVSPTPDGIGFVEVVLPAFYVGFHLPLAIGTAVTLTFRAFSFWLPIFIGFIAVRRLRLFRSGRVLNSI
ncbi:MAG: flippase-like domain-containing protein [Ardenticatenaceae bacterium]|nr:flippase-like domain-containing protein [Anaerolineales bacterium]MCB8919986.1 flippase-like domain-containing protein [Ardenticatenaceae bacterium]MCB8989833.1 flippase-like domain-containing protein [Ardenticatenaceae bacterium]